MDGLVVGGTGLISTGITRELLARGDRVTVCNRGRTPFAEATSVRQLTGDRTDLPAFEATIAASGTYDCIIDMRCFTPAEAESAVRAWRGRAPQVIFCSTVDVYAKPASRYPVTEAEPRRRGGAFTYAVDKVAREEILEAAHARGDFALTIIRPAHTYGEGGRVVHPLGFSTAFVDRRRKGKPVIVHGGGTSLWASCHRDDVARGFVAAVGNPAAYERAYHVTGDEWLTWNRYVALVAEAAGAPPPRIVHIPTDLLGAVAPARLLVRRELLRRQHLRQQRRARRSRLPPDDPLPGRDAAHGRLAGRARPDRG